MTNKPKHVSLPQKLLSLSDTAEILGCSVKTVRRCVNAGKLATIRDGRLIRVHPDDLNRYISNHRCG